MTSCVRMFNGAPVLFINNEPHTAEMVYATPLYAPDFAAAGLHIYNCICDSCDWWTGPHEYDFSTLDSLLAEYVTADPDALFFPRVCIGYSEESWWAEFAPHERSEARFISSNEPVNMYGDSLRARGSGASFASDVWLGHVEHALGMLVEHIERGPFAERVIGYHIGASISGEWFAWNTFELDRCEDYSPSMLTYFRAWLTRKYGNDCAVQKAWHDESVSLESAQIPSPAAVEGADGYLAVDQRVIDFRTCFSHCTAAAVSRATQAVKKACDARKVTGVFFGYFWPHRNITNPARAGHACLRDVIDLESVDIIISPCHYDNRGIGGYMDAQSLPDVARQHGKLFLHEIDTPTCINNIPLKPWMAHMTLPDSAAGSIEIMKRDWAASAVKRAAYWWMDLHDQGWFHDPELVQCMKRLRELGERVQQSVWRQTSQVAVVLSEEACYHQKLHGTQRYDYLTVLRQWSLSRAGFTFDTILLGDVLSGQAPEYKLYLFPDLYYIGDTEREALAGKLEAQSSLAFFFHAPGCISSRGCSPEFMAEILGVPCMACEPVVSVVQLCAGDDPLLAGLAPGTLYGSGVNQAEINKMSVHTELSINGNAVPAFVPEPGSGDVLGMIKNTNIPGLLRIRGTRATILYSYAPAPPWQLMRNAAREAGVHIWCESGDGVYADNRIVALHAVTTGEKSIRFPKPVTISDPLSDNVEKTESNQCSFYLEKGETKLLQHWKRKTR